MEKKQSSVEWFITEFQKQIEFVPNSELDLWFKNLFPKAKAMHKEEIEDAWINGTRGQMIAPFGINRYKPDAEEYYNETFGGNNE
jgi:hypothetical protein